jgi:hypothetical protein
VRAIGPSGGRRNVIDPAALAEPFWEARLLLDGKSQTRRTVCEKSLPVSSSGAVLSVARAQGATITKVERPFGWSLKRPPNVRLSTSCSTWLNEIPEATIGSTALNCFNRFAHNRIHVHFLDNEMRLTHQPVRRGPSLALKALARPDMMCEGTARMDLSPSKSDGGEQCWLA